MTQKTIVSSGSQGSDAGRASAGPNDLGLEAKQIAGDVKQLAGEAADQAKQFAQDQIATRKERAVGALGDVAEALRASGGRLGSKNGAEAAQYVTRVADGLDRVSGYLKDRDLTDVMHDVEGFARREPAIFLGGAFVLGLVGSRFLKSSRAPRRQPGEQGGALSTSSMPSYRIGSSSSGGQARNGNQSDRSMSASTSAPKAKSATGGSTTGGASTSGGMAGNSSLTGSASGSTGSTGTRPAASSSSPSSPTSPTSPTSPSASSSSSGAPRPPSNGPRGSTPGTT